MTKSSFMWPESCCRCRFYFNFKIFSHSSHSQAAAFTKKQKGSSLLTGASELSSLFHKLSLLIHTFEFVKEFWRRETSPRIIVIANPDIIELQSDRATPGAARAITLRPGSRWKGRIRGKPLLKNREVLADNVSIPTKVITAGLRGGLAKLY